MESITKITARYAETDRMGIIHHSVYPVWFEVGRTDYIKQCGMSYSEMEKSGVMTPLSELHCKYFKPAYYEDRLLIKTTVSKISAARITFNYKVVNESTGELLCVGSTVHGFVDTNTFRPVNSKKALPEIFEKINNNLVEE